MADTVTVDTIHDGPRNAIIRMTSVSDGTGEALVAKVNAANLGANSLMFQAPNRLRINRVDFTTQGMSVNLFWGGTPNILAISLPATFAQMMSFDQYKGLSGLNPPASLVSPTGIILLSTVNHAAGDTYDIILHLTKKYPASTY